MELLYEGKYLMFWHDADNKLFHYVFGANTEHMTPEEYMGEINVFIDFLRQYKPIRVLGDMKEFKFPITPDMQDWLNNNLFPVYQEIDFKKIAILLSTEFIAALSIEQAMEADNSKAFQTAYLDNEAKALEWLLVK